MLLLGKGTDQHPWMPARSLIERSEQQPDLSRQRFARQVLMTHVDRPCGPSAADLDEQRRDDVRDKPLGSEGCDELTEA